MKDTIIKKLDKDFLIQRINDFISLLDKSIEEYWTAENFLVELNGKWEYSVCLLNDMNDLLGYIISSKKEISVHIHKFMIGQNYRNKGYGKILLDAIIQECEKNHNNLLTLKVYKDNPKALNFYLKNGFFEISRASNLILLGKNLT